jgi:hypothetical protein
LIQASVKSAEVVAFEEEAYTACHSGLKVMLCLRLRRIYIQFR